MTRISVVEAKAVRDTYHNIIQLKEIIDDYKHLEKELGINLSEQIETMQDELDELKRGLKYV